EGELWPNFLRVAQQRGVPVVVVNGRLSPRSARRYRRLRSLSRPTLRRVTLFAVQTEEYARTFEELGVPRERLRVTGSVKYDGVETNRHNPRTEAMRRLLGMRSTDRVWVAGSTQAPEEEMALDIYRSLKVSEERLRLILVPRQKE